MLTPLDSLNATEHALRFLPGYGVFDSAAFSYDSARIVTG
jgi:hypothetical protein